MLVLGLQGSPRKKGNSNHLMQLFMEQAAALGARTKVVDAARRKISPCREIGVCESDGHCPIKDEMHSEVYGLLREADIVVAATPVFFYNMTAQLKALIDRCQALWARKYRLKIKDPSAAGRKGFMLSVAATRGKNLFEAIDLTCRYFFDAISAEYTGSLTYRGVEDVGDMAAVETAALDVQLAVTQLMAPLQHRKRVLFVGRDNALGSQMAAAFARQMAWERLDVASAGVEVARQVAPQLESLMAEKGLDLGFAVTHAFEEMLDVHRPDVVIHLGDEDSSLDLAGIEVRHWSLAFDDPDSEAEFCALRDRIEMQVATLVDDLA